MDFKLPQQRMQKFVDFNVTWLVILFENGKYPPTKNGGIRSEKSYVSIDNL